MFQQQVQIINTFLMIFDAICVILAAYCAYFFRILIGTPNFSIAPDVFIASIMVVIIANNYFFGRFKLYGDQKIQSHLLLISLIAKAVTLDFAILSMGIFLSKQSVYSRLFLLYFALLTFLTLYLERLITNSYINKISNNNFNTHQILIVGSQKRSLVVKELLEKQISWGHKIIGRLSLEPESCVSDDYLGSVERFPEIIRHSEIDEVVFALNGDKNIVLSEYLYECRRMGVLVRILPSLWQVDDPSISMEKCQTVPFITIKTANFDATGLLYKRGMDILGGLVGTILFCVMYPFIAAAIKFDSKGPVIFKQARVGQHGRIFDLYKFRSMFEDAEELKKGLILKNEMNGNMFKLRHDPRITLVGKFLRKTSLDEFPQFLNVLKGEMSLVGTRPPLVDEVKTYTPEHLKRLTAKPGITGLWQISGRNQIRDFDQVVALDCQYLDNWRFLDDIKIIFKTINVVLKRKGAI
jgi:exopolysaccharide biosynthesis polyprenyl glycosylphosphotransferase